MGGACIEQSGNPLAYQCGISPENDRCRQPMLRSKSLFVFMADTDEDPGWCLCSLSHIAYAEMCIRIERDDRTWLSSFKFTLCIVI